MCAINAVSDSTNNFGDCLQARNMYIGVRAFVRMLRHLKQHSDAYRAVCVFPRFDSGRDKAFLSPSPHPRPRSSHSAAGGNAGSFPGCIDSPRVNQTTRSHLQTRKKKRRHLPPLPHVFRVRWFNYGVKQAYLN
jgi:hypothetical protein